MHAGVCASPAQPRPHLGPRDMQSRTRPPRRLRSCLPDAAEPAGAAWGAGALPRAPGVAVWAPRNPRDGLVTA